MYSRLVNLGLKKKLELMPHAHSIKPQMYVHTVEASPKTRQMGDV